MIRERFSTINIHQVLSVIFNGKSDGIRIFLSVLQAILPSGLGQL
ncbi:hypothetical protein SSYM_1008 [Serratia symbiotica str. Tucson]|uniref:Uncharacterized protein n=2 Tax=Serratia symbiotica TaxID=138074 RepID=E9CLA9_9GAMM|nr:hypothetical protein SSYM_1008 [Serratia symbiotica str. Tucson]BBI92556.1 uncharacterized protein SSYIS1_23290 [Serratia symbiotica]